MASPHLAPLDIQSMRDPRSVETAFADSARDYAENAGRKDDAEKLRYSLVPVKALRAIVQVLDFGARKYGADNWRKVHTGRERYREALLRHVYAWMDGERLDLESGLPHLAHAGCCILFLLELDRGVEAMRNANGVGE